MTGRLAGMARKAAYRAPMELFDHVDVSTSAGLAGDYRGSKYPKRQVTVLAREAWEEAVAMLGMGDIPWIARRANLLVEGIDLPKITAAQLRIGPLLLEVTVETVPCSRMDEVMPGLRKALSGEWRGGLTCRVLEGGGLKIGDAVEVTYIPSVKQRVLPG
jgi:MOSC domain-containing protein YiiM